MQESKKQEDSTVKLSPKAEKALEKKAKPFESKRACLERIVLRGCTPDGQENEMEEDLEE